MAACAVSVHAGRWKYESFTLEHYSFGLSVAHQAVKYGAEVIVYSEPPLGVALGALRRWFGLRYRTLFSNGAPFVPPYPYADHVQQLAPVYLDQALRYGVPANTQSLVPYGFAVPALDPATKADLRRRLNLPPDRPIIICVAAINASHKRLDYLIDEAAGLGRPGPFVLFLGQTEPESEGIKARAASALAADQYRFLSIPSAEVGAYYQASDLFVLPSIHEGFGRVFGEAMFRGLPCLAHDYPVARYVLGDLGFYADFTRPGGLTGLLRHCLENLPGLAQMADERRNAIRERFSWERLLPAYERLLSTAAGRAAA